MTTRTLIYPAAFNLQGSCHFYLQHEAEGVAAGVGRLARKQTSGSCPVHLGVPAKLLSFPPSLPKNKEMTWRGGKGRKRGKGRAAETWTASTALKDENG